MKFSPRDLHILSAYQSRIDNPIAQTAQAASAREHIVRRTVSRAQEAEVLTRRVYVNFFRLGLQQYSIFFSDGATSKAQRARLREALLKAPCVELLLEVGGAFSFGVVLTVRSVFDVDVFFRWIAAKSSVPIKTVQFHQRTGWHYFGVKYLHPRVHPPPIHIVASGEAPIDLSSEDSRLLHAFTLAPDGSRAHIARTLGIPVTTFQYQVQRLTEAGVIAGVRCQVAPGIVGYQSYRVLVRTGILRASDHEAIFNWAKRHPHVVSMMHGVGSWQYELRVEAPSFAAASDICEDLTEYSSDYVHNVELLPVARVLKMQLAPDPVLFDR